MPSKEEHRNQANHNRQFWQAHDLTTSQFLDWVVTGIFYEAVHWVEAYLADRGDHPTTHGQRTTSISQYADLDAITVDYDILKTESENARYNCHSHSLIDIRDDLVPLVDNIRNQVTPLL